MAFGINGRPFDMARLDLRAAMGTTERWIVAGQMMGHPFHVHGVRFRVASENGRQPRPENSGWKDTVFVEGETELLVRFDHGATAEKPFMIHCHILEHEDAGMMAQFAVA
jgi:FtsP/CotA-like multicopper oxidase with cupredoxin domain